MQIKSKDDTWRSARKWQKSQALRITAGKKKKPRGKKKKGSDHEVNSTGERKPTAPLGVYWIRSISSPRCPVTDCPNWVCRKNSPSTGGGEKRKGTTKKRSLSRLMPIYLSFLLFYSFVIHCCINNSHCFILKVWHEDDALYFGRPTTSLSYIRFRSHRCRVVGEKKSLMSSGTN